MRRCFVGLLLVSLVGCAGQPPARGPIGPALLGGFGDALACGGPLLIDALAKHAGPADYLDASTCFVERQLQRHADRMEAAPVPSVEHGERVVDAARAAERYEQHPCPEHEREAAEALRACGGRP